MAGSNAWPDARPYMNSSAPSPSHPPDALHVFLMLAESIRLISYFRSNPKFRKKTNRGCNMIPYSLYGDQHMI